MQEIMRLEKSARFLREKLRDRAKKAKEKNVEKKKEEKSVVKNAKKKKEKKISDKELYKEPKFINVKKEQVDAHVCPGCEGTTYVSSQALWLPSKHERGMRKRRLSEGSVVSRFTASVETCMDMSALSPLNSQSSRFSALS